jgi:dihydroorotate dehydrogenase electron transfer subunit
MPHVFAAGHDLPGAPRSAFSIIETNPLPGGYCELTVRSSKELSPLPEPGQYLRAMLAPGTPLSFAPILKAQSADTFQVLAQTAAARGTGLLNARIEGDAPAPDPARAHIVLVSAESALACSIFAASRLRLLPQYALTVFAQFDRPMPFKAVPSQIMMPACPSGVIAAVPLLDSWNIPSRLAGAPEQSGFYHGDVDGLLESWWQRLDKDEHFRVQILGFGAHSFLGKLRDWCEAQRIPLRTAEIPI